MYVCNFLNFWLNSKDKKNSHEYTAVREQTVFFNKQISGRWPRLIKTFEEQIPLAHFTCTCFQPSITRLMDWNINCVWHWISILDSQNQLIFPEAKAIACIYIEVSMSSAQWTVKYSLLPILSFDIWFPVSWIKADIIYLCRWLWHHYHFY